MAELIVGTAGTIEALFADDEDPVDADADVTVTVVDAFGTEVVAATTATNTDVGTYTVDVGPLTDPARLTATWTGTFAGTARSTVTGTDVIGSHIITVAELRNRDSLGDIDRTPIDQLRRARTQFRTMAANHIGAPIVPTYVLVDAVGTGSAVLPLPRLTTQVLEASIDDEPVTDTITVTPSGYAMLETTTWTYGATITVGAVAGMDPTPAELTDAAGEWIEWRLARSRSGLVDPRATSVTSDQGTFRLSTPGGSTGRGAPTLTGLPQVDATLNSYRYVTAGR